MERVRVALLLIVVLVTVAACGGSSSPSATPTATLPPAPVSTSTTRPTSTPQSTETPSVPAVEILNSTIFTARTGSHYIIGELRNNTTEYGEFVKIVATFYDSSGTVIGSDFTYSERDIIPPGETSPFELIALDIPAPDSFQLQTEGRISSTRPIAGLEIPSQTSRVTRTGSFEVVGEVVNNSGSAVDFVKIIGAFYDSDGEIVGVGFTYTELDALQSGGSSPFSLLVIDGSGTPPGGVPLIADYRLFVEANLAR